jgi:hypothetical protein
MIFLTPHIVTNPVEAAELSEQKLETFEDFKRYEMREPELDFHGPPEKADTFNAPDSGPARESAEGSRLDEGDSLRQREKAFKTDSVGESAAGGGHGDKKGTLDPLTPGNQEISAAAVISPEKTDARFRVRTGVYFSKTSLEREKTILEGLGYHPYMVTKKIMRNQSVLRIGPLPGLPDYMDILRQSEGMGLTVVKVDDDRQLYAHVTTARQTEVISNIAAHWKQRGYDAVIIKRRVPREIHWLMAGAYRSRAEAEETRRSLKQDGIDSLVIENRRPE